MPDDASSLDDSFYSILSGRDWDHLKPAARELRHTPTPAEDALWQRLRKRQVAGAKFRRQHAINRYIVDFYCLEAKLIIEVDGPVHADLQSQDRQRQEVLESMGQRVIRFTNDDVLHHINSVVERIRQTLQPGDSSPTPDDSPAP